jgi:hypothetical protein
MSLPAFDSNESKMTMPGFTAALSLRGMDRPYAAHALQRGQAGGDGMVVPQCTLVCNPQGCQWFGCDHHHQRFAP